jgi:hypothetical protein
LVNRVERLRSALEQIAFAADKDEMRTIARKALGDES